MNDEHRVYFQEDGIDAQLLLTIWQQPRVENSAKRHSDTDRPWSLDIRGFSWVHLCPAAERRKSVYRPSGVLLNCNSRWRMSDPLARSTLISPHEGEINACNVRAILPLREGE